MNLLYFIQTLSMPMYNLSRVTGANRQSYKISKALQRHLFRILRMKSKKISNDQELIQSDPISCPQNQKGNNHIHKLTAVYERDSR